MAVADPLTATHRRAQLAVRARVLADLRRLWPAMDWERLDRTFPLWAAAVSTLITRHRATSTSLAGAYLRAFRFSAGLTDAPTIVLAEPIPDEKLDAVLRVTSIVSLKAAATAGVARDRALANAFVRSAGAATRLVLEGGRDTIVNTVEADDRAVGWERVTGGSSCDFCSMLAGRGAVYSGSTAHFQTHDHCSCTAQPVFA